MYKVVLSYSHRSGCRYAVMDACIATIVRSQSRPPALSANEHDCIAFFAVLGIQEMLQNVHVLGYSQYLHTKTMEAPFRTGIVSLKTCVFKN